MAYTERNIEKYMDILYEIFFDANTLTAGAQIGLNERALREIRALHDEFSDMVAFRVTEQVVEEVVAQFERALTSQVSKLKASTAWLANYFDLAEVAIPETNAKMADEFVRAQLTKAGIMITQVELDKLDLSAILTSIFRKKGMLGESDKGAKDMVIAASINFVRTPIIQTFVVSNDSKFRDYMYDKFTISGFESIDASASALRLTLNETNVIRRGKLTELANEYWVRIQDVVYDKIRTDYKRQFPPHNAANTLSGAISTFGNFEFANLVTFSPDPTKFTWYSRIETISYHPGALIYVREHANNYEWAIPVSVEVYYEGVPDNPQPWSQGLEANHTVKYEVQFSFKVDTKADKILEPFDSITVKQLGATAHYNTIFRSNPTFINTITNPGLGNTLVPVNAASSVFNVAPISSVSTSVLSPSSDLAITRSDLTLPGTQLMSSSQSSKTSLAHSKSNSRDIISVTTPLHIQNLDDAVNNDAIDVIKPPE